MCFAVSELSELAKQYVLRILFVEQPVTQTVMTAWMTSEHGRYWFHFAVYVSLKWHVYFYVSDAFFNFTTKILAVSTSAIVCLETFVFEMTCCRYKTGSN